MSIINNETRQIKQKILLLTHGIECNNIYYQPAKFCRNPARTFWVRLHADRQTDRQTDKQTHTGRDRI